MDPHDNLYIVNPISQGGSGWKWPPLTKEFIAKLLLNFNSKLKVKLRLTKPVHRAEVGAWLSLAIKQLGQSKYL